MADSDFIDLVARAISPTMSREEREAVYQVVRQAVQRLQAREGLCRGDPRTELQLHLIEETISEVEGMVTRFIARRTIDTAAART
ncbi:conserved hypothetical protein [Methylobacterium sp. 4-46]|uniref:hypothetical protein n=1 Tax=unclassified Methylobacterium TaxID=2615210 RepID=UPI000165CDF4|nr:MULTISPECIES: hypothetical protein [Methylobacterium]ACA19201.1 conserved hypothetical protein [Methylobacterium sp. 4-46]WFT78409.1 hypothetical protein QA634_24490 [Methylobacterium nodulans]